MARVSVEQLIREEIQALSAYHVPPSEGMIKLDAMENPYSWPDGLPQPLRQTWLDSVSKAQINRYPDPAAQRVKEALREAMSIPQQHGLLLGNGSDEIIQLLAMAVAKPGRVILSPEPSFVMYQMIAAFVGMGYVGVPLDQEFQLDLDAMLEAIASHQPAIIFLAQPNNPTGTIYSRDQVEAIIKAAEGLVVIDEAYLAFTESDYLDMLDLHDNVLVMRTLSKVGLAGLRLGMLVGDPVWLDQIEKLRLPYNINVLTQISAQFALEHYDYFKSQTETIKQQREKFQAQLRQWEQQGLLDRFWPSQANFVLMKTLAGTAREVFAALKEKGILIKCLDGAHPQLQDCLRLTVGSPAEMESLAEAFFDILDGHANQ